MYCEEYCLGKDSEQDCSKYTSTPDKLTECIKSCLDCRSPNKKYCYCPSIFPPPVNTARMYEGGGGGARHLHMRANEGRSDGGVVQDKSGLKGTVDPDEDDLMFYVGVGVGVVVVAILLAIFCVIRYMKRKKSAQPTTKPGPPEQGPVQPVPQTDPRAGRQRKSRGPPEVSASATDEEA